jgi:hypothetical protein
LHQTVKIRSVNINFSNKALTPPIKCNTTSDIESFSSFIEQYQLSIPKINSDLFGFWHKINRAWQSGISNSALSIVVAIEGILKGYFGKYGVHDTEILKQAENVKLQIKDLKLDKRIRDRLFSNIGQLKSPSPKNALFEMASRGFFPSKLVDEWVSLRNKSAHADTVEPDDEVLQAYIDQIYSCLTLFYLLVFQIIGYQGKFIDFSQRGWPEKNWGNRGRCQFKQLN